MPLAIKAFQSVLSPSQFYGCSVTATEFQLYKMGYRQGLEQALL